MCISNDSDRLKKTMKHCFKCPKCCTCSKYCAEALAIRNTVVTGDKHE